MIDNHGSGPSPALEVALAYFQAWTGHNVERALTLVSSEIVCDAPSGRLEGPVALRAFIEGFAQIVTDARIIAAFGDDHTALIMYDTATVPVPSAPAAEAMTVESGRITRIHMVFDRAPFDAARAR